MPVYMDRHDLPGVTANDVAEAHQNDLKVQEHYGCRALTYWFDEQSGTAFCLVEAPDADAVREMHAQAHGLVPHEIIEVDKTVIQAFLGRIRDPTSVQHNEAGFPVFTDSAFRAVMAVSVHAVDHTVSKGQNKSGEQEPVNRMRKKWKQYNGCEVECSDEVYVASFSSVTQAFACADAIGQDEQVMQAPFAGKAKKISIGLSTGLPVAGSKQPFGDALLQAKRLCMASGRHLVLASATVRDFFKKTNNSVSGLNAGTKILNQQEENFLNQLMVTTENRWHDAGLTTADLAKQSGFSRVQLYRKMTAITGLAPNDFLREFRLQKAFLLLEKQGGSVSEIAYESGFTSPSYFSKCFQKRFGVLPSAFAAAAGA